MVILFLFLIFL